jgi:hypothetical protein
MIKADYIVTKTYYKFKDNGLECNIMFDTDKGEALACFFALYYGEDEHWKFEFYQIKDNSIIAHENYTSLQMALANEVKYFKAGVNFNKTKALICGLLDYGNNICFNFDSSQNQLLTGYTFPNNSRCLMEYYGFKVNYFKEKDEFLYSCVGDSNNLIHITYTYNNNELIFNCFEDLEKECEYFIGYDFYYSQENNDYYYLSDYTCNKSLDIIASTSFVERQISDEGICKSSHVFILPSNLVVVTGLKAKPICSSSFL